MRPRTALLALAALSIAAGCGELHKLTKLKFSVTKGLAPETIQSSIAPCQLTANLPIDLLSSPFQITMSQSQDFPQQNTDVQHIDSAKLTELKLALTSSSAQQTWDFLTSVTLYAQANGQTRAAVASIGVGSVSGIPIPQGATTLSLTPTGLELAPYIKASGGFTITSEATGCPPSQDATFGGDAKFAIVADPL